MMPDETNKNKSVPFNCGGQKRFNAFSFGISQDYPGLKQNTFGFKIQSNRSNPEAKKDSIAFSFRITQDFSGLRQNTFGFKIQSNRSNPEAKKKFNAFSFRISQD